MRRGGDETYETHVTVRCDGEHGRGRLDAWARTAGLKVTHIVLARGRMVSQPMLTLRGGDGLAAQQAAAHGLVTRLREAGFAPVRVKTETTPWAAEVATAPDGYFEHHLKLLLDEDFDRAALTAIAVRHGAHLSWNARRVTGAGRHERFVTQRCRGVSARTAGLRCDELAAELTAAGHRIVSQEREFVLHDSDLSVDDGWIEEVPGR
ncbi:hypothetical protein ACFQ60_18305 [Streptomyces zhihengii]|uniref:Ankyrin n=1 Tax=Streptomyces zhihengii TaxID=1818004 RepID=A0ABS2UYD8_9ACTN|nr:hypothetical protein [Streptomyces zhihengii]MBM9621720.1 hypothetical protein [Streptomyces zhihengii]